MTQLDDLIKKYDRACPRYTSYPPINLWENETSKITATEIQTIQQSHQLNFYIHFPYCKQLCHYCGCHRSISKNEDVYSNYIEVLKKEIDLYKQHINTKKSIGEIHFGGGTPSLISTKDLQNVLKSLKSINEGKSPESLSIEIDPRTCDEEKLQELIDLGFNRFSFGIQDFNGNVQNAIGRIQGIHKILPLVHCLQKNNISSYNFDMIVGLPSQNLKTMKDSIDIALHLKPARIALYSYAHLPVKIPNQRLIDASLIPSSDERMKMIMQSREQIAEAGYVEIGMDHFAKKEDSIAKARASQTIHRNFMGYTDRQPLPLIGLGVSSISDYGGFYAQNYKDFKTYKEQVERGNIAFQKTHRLTTTQRHTKKLILDAFCKMKVKKQDILNLQKLSTQLDSLRKDGLIEIDNEYISVPASKVAFIRYLARCLDPMQEDLNSKIYSSAI